MAFSLVKNCKMVEYPERNCKLTWDFLVSEYTPNTATSLLKLKKKFENARLSYLEKLVSKLDGKASERTGKIILDLINNKNK